MQPQDSSTQSNLHQKSSILRLLQPTFNRSQTLAHFSPIIKHIHAIKEVLYLGLPSDDVHFHPETAECRCFIFILKKKIFAIILYFFLHFYEYKNREFFPSKHDVPNLSMNCFFFFKGLHFLQ